MRFITVAILVYASQALLWPQAAELKTTEAVLEKYQRALGGVEAIKKVQSETRHGEFESPGQGKGSFVAYSKPFKSLSKVTLPGGAQMVSGFDGTVSWSIGPKGPSIDKSTPVEAVRRDADLQYPLHEADYFDKYELAGVVDFEGRRCYWMHGTTHWGKDNNQYYDVETGLLSGYRFQSDNSATAVVTTLLFQDYKSFGGPLVATKNVVRSGSDTQTVRFTSVSYEPLADSMFELPAAVKALLE
jgi:zinc protease